MERTKYPAEFKSVTPYHFHERKPPVTVACLLCIAVNACLALVSGHGSAVQFNFSFFGHFGPAFDV
jgi:hypothetical protein